MGLDDDFTAAAEAVKNLKRAPNDDQLLQLYGLYKQGTLGDVGTSRPGMFDLKGKAKWDAYAKLKGTSQAEAKEKYIAYVRELQANDG